MLENINDHLCKLKFNNQYIEHIIKKFKIQSTSNHDIKIFYLLVNLMLLINDKLRFMVKKMKKVFFHVSNTLFVWD
jgi:glycerol-3-phosphate responsive antiterminator